MLIFPLDLNKKKTERLLERSELSLQRTIYKIQLMIDGRIVHI